MTTLVERLRDWSREDDADIGHEAADYIVHLQQSLNTALADAAFLRDRVQKSVESPALRCDAAEEYVIKAFLALGHRATDGQVAEVAAKVRAALPQRT